MGRGHRIYVSFVACFIVLYETSQALGAHKTVFLIMLVPQSNPFGIAFAALALYALPTVASLCPIIQTAFFNQTLNYDLSSPSSSAGNGTFQQQYQLNTTFFRPGGPILFYQGAEVGTIGCMENYAFWDWVDEMGAIAAGLEHRFFGLSFPAGFNTSTATPSDWAPLTINNTLMDSVNFIEWIKKTVPGADKSKAIVMGGNILCSHVPLNDFAHEYFSLGSYGGTLSALLRLFHPETFYGAISSAPLLKSFGPEASDPDKYE